MQLVTSGRIVFWDGISSWYDEWSLHSTWKEITIDDACLWHLTMVRARLLLASFSTLQRFAAIMLGNVRVKNSPGSVFVKDSFIINSNLKSMFATV
ncbi:hypothetical protein CEXT_521091 [Caerostris extrusa]|uniref:Uncharacterized protein n=1 Tax=Caerostris extrusa TaxID=172846 RepID=A0AAV4XBS8_CAEEX|nr:hypothetical protein CEXT_521091 [Caerostris extrusa]